jgi:hypothetical protein
MSAASTQNNSMFTPSGMGMSQNISTPRRESSSFYNIEIPDFLRK